jgi:hypothetical protein
LIVSLPFWSGRGLICRGTDDLRIFPDKKSGLLVIRIGFG